MRNIIMTVAVATFLVWFEPPTAGEERVEQQMFSPEGMLKVHPKFLYDYYLAVGPNQVCALYGSDHGRKPDVLSSLKEGSRVHVRGTLGTYHHPGSTDENLSPFPPAWVICMDVHEATQAEVEKSVR